MTLTLMGLVLIAAGFYVGWNIGSNDAANCIGTTVGAQFLPYRTAALLMAFFVILGGTLQGHAVMKTVGKGIVITDAASYEEVNGIVPPEAFHERFPEERLSDRAILVALLSAGIFVTLATVSRVPVSTSQAIVGGVAGTGLGIVGFDAAYFKLHVVLKILACWVFCPVLTLVLAYLVYQLLRRLLRHARSLYWSRVLGALLVITACYVSYSLGANDVGNAIGPLLNRYPDRGRMLALLGGLAMAVGALTLGRRVSDTVGKSITPLDMPSAVASQLSAAVGVHLFSALWVPVSTSQAIVGAVIGVGLTKGTRAVKFSKIGAIAAGWVVTPACAALFAMGVYRWLSWLGV